MVRGASFDKNEFKRNLAGSVSYPPVICTVGWDVLYHYNTDEPPPDWTDWNGPLTSATNHIIARFISGTIGVATLPHHALLIAQLSLNAGGLGILDPRTRAIPDFMLTFTTSTRHATEYT
jgi:hypothetical protein